MQFDYSILSKTQRRWLQYFTRLLGFIMGFVYASSVNTVRHMYPSNRLPEILRQTNGYIDFIRKTRNPYYRYLDCPIYPPKENLVGVRRDPPLVDKLNSAQSQINIRSITQNVINETLQYLASHGFLYTREQHLWIHFNKPFEMTTQVPSFSVVINDLDISQSFTLLCVSDGFVMPKYCIPIHIQGEFCFYLPVLPRYHDHFMTHYAAPSQRLPNVCCNLAPCFLNYESQYPGTIAPCEIFNKHTDLSYLDRLVTNN